VPDAHTAIRGHPFGGHYSEQKTYDMNESAPGVVNCALREIFPTFGRPNCETLKCCCLTLYVSSFSCSCSFFFSPFPYGSSGSTASWALHEWNSMSNVFCLSSP